MPGVGMGISLGIGKVFYVMVKVLTGELSCPCDRSCFLIINPFQQIRKQEHRMWVPTLNCSCLLENSKLKKGHNYVGKILKITSPTNMGSPFDSINITSLSFK